MVAASGRGYALVEQGPALTVMSLLVVVTAILALRQNAQIVAHLSLVAAFAAPLLISKNSGNYVGLFSFYTTLNLGILGMCLRRPWRRLYLTGFSLSFGIFALWVARAYTPAMFHNSAPFLTAFYLFYTFIGLHTAHNIALEGPDEAAAPPRRFRTDLTLVIMAPIVFLSTMSAMVYKPYTLAMAAAASGLMYVLIFFLRGAQLPPLTRRIILWQGIIGLNLGLALFLFDLNPQALSRWTILSLTWSLEGAMLHYSGQKSGQRESVYFGLGCLGLAALFSFGAFGRNGSHVASQFLIVGLVLGGALLHAAWAAQSVEKQRGVPHKLPLVLAIMALLAWGFFPGFESLRQMLKESEQYAINWLCTVWSLLALALWALTRRAPRLLDIAIRPKKENRPLPVLAAARIAVFAVFLFQFRGLAGMYFGMHSIILSGYDLLFQAIALALFFSSQALSLRQAREYRRLTTVWSNLWAGVLALSLGWFLFSLAVTLRLPEPLPDLARLAVALAVLGLFLFPPRGRAWLQKIPWDCLLPTVGLVSAIALWHFAAMIDDPAYFTAMAYLPLLNITDIFQAAAAILPLAALYTAARSRRPRFCPPLLYALGILLFVWLNLVLGRAVHHYAWIPYHYEALFRSGYFQSLAALVWGAAGIGAMISGHRAARRPQWLLGAALLVADLAKIFFIDLSQIGTVARIVSFLAVGTLLILVGYFAPLPPAAREKLNADEKQ